LNSHLTGFPKPIFLIYGAVWKTIIFKKQKERIKARNGSENYRIKERKINYVVETDV
jgi:hypothetical protein